MKKALSLLLCVCMLLPVFALCAQAADPVPCPTIYVRGSTKIYRFGEDGSAAAIYDDGDYVVNMLAKAAPLLPAARLTGDYTAYANKVLEVMRPAYDAFRPDLTDGSVPADTRVDWYWTRETVEADSRIQGYFEYWIDERLSPFAQAADLNAFIETVKEVTHHQKVKMYARCLGPVTLFTYLYLYQRPKNYEDVASLAISFSTHNGMSLTDAIYTGSVEIPADGMEKWLAPYVEFNVEGDVSAGVMNAMAALLNGIAKSLGVKLTVKEMNTLYGELKDVLFAPFLREYYALCLENLACVNARFDDMMAYLFPTEAERSTYAYAIGELTRYHETVFPAVNDMIRDIMAQGKPFAVFADYGGQEYPVCEEAMYLGDRQVGTRAMSLGATTARIGETLSADYIAERRAEGLGDYISPDLKIDSSTCEFPDNTYFVSNLNHLWPGAYAGIELDVIQPTVDGSPYVTIPRFSYWDADAGTLVPLAPAPEAEQPTGIAGFFARIRAFFENIFQKIADFFANIGK